MVIAARQHQPLAPSTLQLPIQIWLDDKNLHRSNICCCPLTFIISFFYLLSVYPLIYYIIFKLISKMADPLSTASGVVALAVFAFQSSRVLYQTVASFQSNQRNVRQLKEELEALNGALEALQETAANPDVDLAMLQLPLFRCGKACEDFEALIAKCTAHSSGSRTSFRDWARLQYMGDDIVGFKNMLAGYKSTIMIALGDANM